MSFSVIPPSSSFICNNLYANKNVAMSLGNKVVINCIITKFVVATPYRHRDLNSCRIFSGPYYLVALWHCRCREAKKIVTCPAL